MRWRFRRPTSSDDFTSFMITMWNIYIGVGRPAEAAPLQTQRNVKNECPSCRILSMSNLQHVKQVFPLRVSSCSLPPRDSYWPWHRFWKSMHTHTLPVIAHFLTSFNASVPPGFTRQDLLSYIWRSSGRSARPQHCFIPSCSGLRWTSAVSVSDSAVEVAVNGFSMCLKCPVIYYVSICIRYFLALSEARVHACWDKLAV